MYSINLSLVYQPENKATHSPKLSLLNGAADLLTGEEDEKVQKLAFQRTIPRDSGDS